MARASRGESWEKAKSPFATRLWLLMNGQPGTTQAQLAEITGKTRQTISQYVNGISEPGYDTLVKIADHFQVSLDYLLGRTADPRIQPSAVDELGISPKAIEWIKLFVKNDTECSDYDDTASIFNSLLEDENASFTIFFYQMCSFFHAKRAEYIYDSLLAKEYPLDESGSRAPSHESMVEFNRKIKKALEDTTYPFDIPKSAKREDYLPHAIADYLEAILELEDSEPGDSNYIDVMDGLFGLRVSEIPELRARKAFDSLLRTLDCHAEIEGKLENIPKCLSEAMR